MILLKDLAGRVNGPFTVELTVLTLLSASRMYVDYIEDCM